MKKKLFALGLITSALCAQTLTMDESVLKTLQTHPDVKNFALEISKSEQNTLAARSAFLPHINLQAEYDLVRSYVLPKNGELSTSNQSNTQIGLTLQQKVFDFNKTPSLFESAKLDQEIAKLNSLEIKNLLTYKVQTLYETILIQKELIEVRNQDLLTKEELYKQSLAFEKQGLKTSSDSTRFFSAYYGAKDALSKAQAEYEKSLLTLSLYTAEKIGLDTKFEKNSVDTTNSRQELSLQNNTQLQIYDKTIEKSRLQNKAFKAEQYGSLDLIAAYTHFDNINAYDTSFVGLALNIPIFSGFELTAKEQSSTIATQIAKESKSSQTLLLKEELEKLLIDTKQYEQSVEAKKIQIEAALSTKNILQARYKEGLATYIELLDVTGIYLSSELELLEAKYNLALIHHKINYLVGANK